MNVDLASPTQREANVYHQNFAYSTSDTNWHPSFNHAPLDLPTDEGTNTPFNSSDVSTEFPPAYTPFQFDAPQLEAHTPNLVSTRPMVEIEHPPVDVCAHEPHPHRSGTTTLNAVRDSDLIDNDELADSLGLPWGERDGRYPAHAVRGAVGLGLVPWQAHVKQSRSLDRIVGHERSYEPTPNRGHRESAPALMYRVPLPSPPPPIPFSINLNPGEYLSAVSIKASDLAPTTPFTNHHLSANSLHLQRNATTPHRRREQSPPPPVLIRSATHHQPTPTRSPAPDRLEVVQQAIPETDEFGALAPPERPQRQQSQVRFEMPSPERTPTIATATSTQTRSAGPRLRPKQLIMPAPLQHQFQPSKPVPRAGQVQPRANHIPIHEAKARNFLKKRTLAGDNNERAADTVLTMKAVGLEYKTPPTAKRLSKRRA